MEQTKFQSLFKEALMNDEFNEFFKEKVKENIEEMFHQEELKIVVEEEDEWETRYLTTTVYLDNEEIFKNKFRKGSSGWSDD